jgi:hypothetical protein
VQPRNKKIMNKIGSGIPRSQSKIYPVAPACLNLSLKRILISFFLKIARERAAGLGKLSEASVIGYWFGGKPGGDGQSSADQRNIFVMTTKRR